ncbi:MAG: DNA repair protein RadC [candidate division WOR-3 bacterium]|nr:DNA repair protein RadC [candidate division WOR-3 bacterium]MCX7948132.1 DNA repair protein RadC [candidate division WOR-3 bacterium]MDW8150790.1 DNA repair protein RadC [candidate division WOR-3 bacterium]
MNLGDLSFQGREQLYLLMNKILPREKLKKLGVNNLKDEELLAIILGTGSKNEDVFKLSKKIINTFGIKGLKSINLETLLQIDGLGLAKASRIICAIELGKRIFSQSGEIIRSLDDVYKILIPYTYENSEVLVVVLLDGFKRVIRVEMLAKGRKNIVNVHYRDIVEICILNSANYIILAHSHPSNNLKPSNEDLEFTKKLANFLKHLEIELIEHVIFSKIGYIGLLNKI